MNEFWNESFLGNSVQSWAFALGLLVGTAILITVFKRFIIDRLKAWSEKTSAHWDDAAMRAIDKSVVPLLYVAAFYFSLQSLTLSPKVTKVFYAAFLFAATFFVLRIITAAIRHAVVLFVRRRDSDGAGSAQQVRGLMLVVQLVLWLLAVVFIIDNLGYDVTTLVAGLGIGGIAIALAAQTVLGDLFSYFAIFFDRPFEIGDFVVVDDKSGTVEYVGIKTTRIRTLNGEQLICSNKDLTDARIHNFKRMETRRIVFKLGVVYETPHDKLRRIPGIVREIIEGIADVKFDRGHFMNFGASSLDFEFVFVVQSAEYNVYMDRQQDIYLSIVAAFEAEGLAFAYPTQTVHMQMQAAAAGAQLERTMETSLPVRHSRL